MTRCWKRSRESRSTSRVWQTFDDRGPERRFVLDRFPCIVVYVVTDTEIQITAVVYDGREPGYWRKRR